MTKTMRILWFVLIMIGITSLYGASSLQNAMLIEQLKKDKSLQADLKAEQQKIGIQTSTPIQQPDKQIKVSDIVVEEPIAKNEDIEKKGINEKPSVVYNNSNYFKNFTPFYYENQISLVDEIEKKQTFIKTDSILTKFGAKFFEFSSNQIMTSGVPDDYILSTGDSLKISVYGLSEYEGEVVVNKDGKIIIPQIGAMNIRGMKYSVAKSAIYKKLQSTYPNTTINITIGNTSPFTVSVVGEVKKPGLYTVNALSKVKDALSMAGGISEIGTMREIQIKRGGKIVATFDLYDLLKGGKDNGDIYLYPGDIIFVPTAKKVVYLDGNVKSPAMYELQNNETLKDLLEISGGLNSDTTKTVKIFRSANGVRTLFEAKIDEKAILQDGDKIVVGKISDVTDNVVYLYGNVYKNDSISIMKNDTVGSLFKRLIDFYGLEKVLMSNTDMNYFLVKRVDKNSLEPKILSGKLSSAIDGDKAFDVKLQSEDKIFIFNQSMTQDIKYVSVDGEVIRDGKFKYFNGMKLLDALMVSGIKKESDLTKIKVVSLLSDNSYSIKYYDFDSANNIFLQPYDTISISNFNKNEKFENVTIKGSVLNEGTYIYSKGLTLTDLINLAGGLKQNANKEQFELVSYSVNNGIREHKVELINFNDAMKKNFSLKPFDEITIRQVSQWNENKTITLKGEVKFPGVYTIMPGEKLSHVIERAGGFTNDAFVEGAVFTRVDIQRLQQDAFKKQLDDLESNMLYLATQPEEAGKTNTSAAEGLQVLDSIRKRAADTVMLGRLSIKLSNDMKEFKDSEFDLILKAGDTLVVPQLEQSVAIMGEVLNPTAVTFVLDKDLWDYIDQAGGLKNSADEDAIFVIKANGEAKRFTKYFLLGSVAPKVETGDTIVVPYKINQFSGLKFAKDITSIIYQIAVSAAALKTVGAY